jgi:hypothetical protein
MYNTIRPHQGLDYRTLAEYVVHWDAVQAALARKEV